MPAEDQKALSRRKQGSSPLGSANKVKHFRDFRPRGILNFKDS